MKQSLQLKLSQHLTLTPQLQQSIRLLQLSTLELNQELEKLLLENPLLEREDPGISDPGISSDRMAELARNNESGAQEPPAAETPAPNPDVSDLDWFGSDVPSAPSSGDDDADPPSLAVDTPNLRRHLLGQLALLKLDARDRGMVSMLIDALDENGYLSISLDELLESLPAELQIEADDLQVALRYLQQLDPVGVGARDPSECLCLQLSAMPESTPLREIALEIARNHLPLLAARDFLKLKKLLHCDDETLKEARHLIQGLNPHPGAAYAEDDTRYVVPDVIVRKLKGVWVASLNGEAMPKLRINSLYASILKNAHTSSASQLSQHLQEARWLIKNVQQRFETILRVSQAIVDRQRHFLEHGEVAMRPLVLREIADLLGLHESTVSRVTTQKFMFTPRGIFELKYFFGSHVATDAGGACSATAIRALIKQMVAAEDGKSPLTDAKISEVLGGQGILVARRTIAKYRESLHIPPVNMRKVL